MPSLAALLWQLFSSFYRVDEYLEGTIAHLPFDLDKYARHKAQLLGGRDNSTTPNLHPLEPPDNTKRT